jgi:long-subunit acyl-CoA synthetase (AMP-forming)
MRRTIVALNHDWFVSSGKMDPSSNRGDVILRNSRSLLDALVHRVNLTPSHPCLWELVQDDTAGKNEQKNSKMSKTTQQESLESLSWQTVYALSSRFGASLRNKFSLERDENVALLMSKASRRSMSADFGCLLVGATPVALYRGQSSESLEPLLEMIDTRVLVIEGGAAHGDWQALVDAVTASDSVRGVVVSDDFYAWRGSAAQADCDERLARQLRADLMMTGAKRRGDVDVLSWPALMHAEVPLPSDAVRAVQRAQRHDSTAAIMFTSGSSGAPKAVRIDNRGMMAWLRAASRYETLPLGEADSTINYMPPSHIVGRLVLGYLGIVNGMQQHLLPTPARVVDYLPSVGATFFGGAPRLFNMLYKGIMSSVAASWAPSRALVRWALAQGDANVRAIETKRERSALELWRFALAKRLVLEPLRVRIFGERMRLLLVGDDRLDADVLRFFWSIGVCSLEAYGLTETVSISHVNTPSHFRLGTVGRPIAGTEQRVDERGELQLRTEARYANYLDGSRYARSTGTRAPLSAGGWIATGDLATIDAQGYATILDRRVHCFSTSAQPDVLVAPAPLAKLVERADALIASAHVHGAGRPHLSAILTPHLRFALQLGASARMLSAAEHRQLLALVPMTGLVDVHTDAGELEALRAAMRRVVASRHYRERMVAAVRASNESIGNEAHCIRRVYLAPFSFFGTELTQTYKVRRLIVEQHFAKQFDRLYDNDDDDDDVDDQGGVYIRQIS